MIINEPEIAATAIKRIPKVWGVEYWVVNTELYCMKFLKINPGFECSIHAHANKDETFVGYSGMVQLNLYSGKKDLQKTVGIHPGESYRIKPETFHSFQSYNVSWVMEVSTHHSDDDVFRLQESRKI